MAVDGATLRYIVYDILRDFKQNNAGAEISEYQLTYWVIVHADRLKKQHIQKIDSGQFLNVFDVNIEVNNDLSSSLSGRKYITLPQSIYDFDLDKGISYITFDQDGGDLPEFSTITFGRTTPGEAKRLYFREEEEPSATNPYFYRIGNLIYFLGIEDESVDSVEVGLYTAFDPTSSSLDIDQPFDFPQDLIPILKRQILDLGSWAMMVPKDMVNDGQSNQGQIPSKKFVSVNDLNPDQQ